MHTDLGLGKLITGEAQRDAVHVAVIPVVAAMDLSPGCHVRLDDEGRATISTSKLVGVVDPYLTSLVPHGSKFWLFLYPGTVTGLRHQWSHPAFEEEKPAETSVMIDLVTNFKLAIAANPRDQSLRSVYADFLEEREDVEEAKRQREWTVSKAESEQWLRRYAAKMNSYDEPQEAFTRLIDGLRSGELYFHGSDLHGLYDLDDQDELKHHADNYLNTAMDWSRFTFSCSC